MAGYDPTAASEYNQLIQQGFDPEEAAQMAGITQEDIGNYSEVNGQLTQNEGPPTNNTDAGSQTDYGTTYDEFGAVVPNPPPTQDTPVNPASDPNQFPAYDDEGNLLPGYAIDPEFGQAYYAGFERTTGNVTTTTASNTSLGTTPPATSATTPPTTSTTANVTTRSLGTTPPAAASATPPTQQSDVNNPYYGLTPQQISALGNADPTDPYIRARLGIPQLSNSPLPATSGFGNIKTGVPLLDSALGLLGGLFSVTGPATKQTAVSEQAATTGAGTPPVTITALAPPTDITEVNPYDPGTTFEIPTVTADTSKNTTLTTNQTDAFYNGTGTITAYQQAEIDRQTAADAAKLYTGSNNEALKEIDLASAAIAKNEVGIAYAQQVIAENNTELADPNISDARRAELEASNVRQQNYIQTATENTLINQNVIEQNAAAYAAGGGNPGDGQAPAEVNASEDPTIQVANNATLSPPTDGTLTILSDAETNALFAGVDANLVDTLVPPPTEIVPVEGAVDDATFPPPADGPVLLTDEQINAIYPPTDPKEIGAIFGTTIISDEARAALSDPAAIREQLALTQFAAENPPPTITAVSVPLSDAEAAALFAEAEASTVQADAPIDPEAQVDPELPQVQELEIVEADTATDVNAEVDPELVFPPDETLVESDAPADVDPLTDEEIAAQDAALQDQALNDLVAEQSPQDVDPAEDPDLAAQDAALQDQILTDMVLDMAPTDVDSASDEELQQMVEDANARDNQGSDWYDAGDVDPGADPGLPQPSGPNPASSLFGGSGPGDAEAATKLSAKNQATLQARYKQPSVTDWRVRLVLAKNSDYLYNALESEGGAGILAPLKAENGVIFPYTPNITMNYQANYDQYDLVHSNYRGIFYKNSRAGDIQLRGTFTAQDTQEANYLLAVIHFFRSATKMFYGQDAQRGTPPPLVYLLGFGDFQFSGHPCVISTFNYNLPNEVDYIRATAPNNYGTNLLNRRTPVAASPGGSNFAGAIRLANALLPKGAAPQIPGIGSIPQAVNNTQRSTYVPTKMEIDITLIPVQTRDQVSKQFSLKDFANGNLIKGGFW